MLDAIQAAGFGGNELRVLVACPTPKGQRRTEVALIEQSMALTNNMSIPGGMLRFLTVGPAVSDIVSILRVAYVPATQQLSVIAVSDAQPGVNLTLNGFGAMAPSFESCAT